MNLRCTLRFKKNLPNYSIMESAAPFTRDFHPLDNARAEHTKRKSPVNRKIYRTLLRRERLSNLWFLRISQNTQISVYQLFVKFVKNQDITKYLSVSLFLGVKLGVDFEITPKLRFAGYKCIHDNKKKMLASGSVPIIL